MFEHLATVAVARFGQAITYTPCEGEAVLLDALVLDHGFGMPPSGWDSEFFTGMARYVEFKISVSDVADEPQYRDSILFQGREFEIRAAKPSPGIGSEKVWWVVYGVADQRGTR